MPQSLVKNYVHIIFSTKGRMPFINDEIEDELFKYIGGVSKHLECNPIIIGGAKDHVHLLLLLSRKISLMKFVEIVKTHSSKWIKNRGDKFDNFYWQRGYGCFSVNPKKIDQVKDYILNQKSHHRKISFQEEYRKFLIKNDLDYDEKYLWD